MTFISILKRPAVVLREHSFALVLMSVIILMATIYPSNMARDYSESRGGHDRASIVAFENYGRHVNTALPFITALALRDWVGLKQLVVITVVGVLASHGPKRLLNDIAANHNIQLARKIALNSAYGAIGNQYFRYFDVRHAEGITMAGQLTIRWIERDVNNYLNKLLKTKDEVYVVASDTDSIYIKLGGMVNKIFKDQSDNRKIVKILDKFSEEKLQPFIDSSFAKLAKYVNAYDQKMIMKREVIANKGIWTAKKRYILNVFNEDGINLKEPKLKIMGIEAVKSSTPAPCRVKIKEALNVIMNKDEPALIDFIENFRTHFKKLPPEDIAYPRSCNNLKKYSSTKDIYLKGTPIHVRGALLYNTLLKKHKLSKYETIQSGDKIKFISLKEPNTLRENVISFSNQLPKEFKLHQYIDYDEMFTKSFLEPLRFIVNAIGWNFEKKSNLDEFF